MDRIQLKGLTLFPRLGVTAWEKEGVQKVSVDLDLFLDLNPAAEQDQISAAVDYQEVCGVCAVVARSRKFHLIEALAHEIVESVLASFPKVDRVAIRLRKTSLPFDAHLECVEVAMERSR